MILFLKDISENISLLIKNINPEIQYIDNEIQLVNFLKNFNFFKNLKQSMEYKIFKEKIKGKKNLLLLIAKNISLSISPDLNLNKIKDPIDYLKNNLNPQIEIGFHLSELIQFVKSFKFEYFKILKKIKKDVEKFFNIYLQSLELDLKYKNFQLYIEIHNKIIKLMESQNIQGGISKIELIQAEIELEKYKDSLANIQLQKISIENQRKIIDIPDELNFSYLFIKNINIEKSFIYDVLGLKENDLSIENMEELLSIKENKCSFENIFDVGFKKSFDLKDLSKENLNDVISFSLKFAGILELFLNNYGEIYNDANKYFNKNNIIDKKNIIEMNMNLEKYIIDLNNYKEKILENINKNIVLKKNGKFDEIYVLKSINALIDILYKINKAKIDILKNTIQYYIDDISILSLYYSFGEN